MSDEATRKEYHDDVEGIARDAYNEAKEGGDAHDSIHEGVDGSQWIIYTYRNLKVLDFSDQEDAAFDEMGRDALSGCSSYGEVMARLAFYAMRADVSAAYQDIVDAEGEPEDVAKEAET